MSIQESVVRAIGRQCVRVLVACCMLVAYYGLVAAPVVAARSPMAGADRWVTGLSDGAFQTARGQFAAYPFEYRQALLKRSTAAERAGVWRKLIVDFRATYSSKFAVTAEREAALDVLSASLTSDLFNGTQPSSADRLALTATTTVLWLPSTSQPLRASLERRVQCLLMGQRFPCESGGHDTHDRICRMASYLRSP